MMNSSRLEKDKKVEDNTIKDIGNIFRLKRGDKKKKKKIDYTKRY